MYYVVIFVYRTRHELRVYIKERSAMKTCLKQIRIEKGFTQSDIANRINISTRQYQRIENNESKPSYDVILKLQSLFNESIDKLLDTIL